MKLKYEHFNGKLSKCAVIKCHIFLIGQNKISYKNQRHVSILHNILNSRQPQLLRRHIIFQTQNRFIIFHSRDDKDTQYYVC